MQPLSPTPIRASFLYPPEMATVDSSEDGRPSASSSRAEQRSSSVQPLPKGAAMPSYQAPSLPSPARPQQHGERLDSVSPPSTPTQRLLDSEPHVQYAKYPSSEKQLGWKAPAVGEDGEMTKPWVPYPLRVWFWVPFVVILVLGAIGLEIALHFSKKNNGWSTHGDFTNESTVMHYVYTLPPVAVAMLLVAMWTWTDIEVKKMQPYVDLVHGDSPPHRSLLLDYTRSNNFVVWTRAAHNRHYLVALTSLMVLLCLAFQPLSAALLVVRDTWWTMPAVTVNNLAQIGLNQNQNFADLTSFLTAAGYAAADVQFSLPDPPFTFGPYSVAPFELPTGIQTNGTVLYVNTTAVKSDPGCQPVQVQQVQLGDGSWNNSISIQGCSLQWIVNHTAEVLFGTNATVCSNQTPPQFSPVAFWFFEYTPSVKASATVCFPSIHLFDVNINYDLAANNITQVTELRPFSSSSNFSSSAGNVTGAPLNGRAYNGIEFNLTNPDSVVLARKDALTIQMPAAILQDAQTSTAGLQASFDTNSFSQQSSNVYTTYLALIAQTVYFIPASDPNTIQIKTVVQRVFLSDVAVHLLATAMLLLAFFATIIQLFHRYDRRSLRLLHEPGTIASAVSIGGQTGIGELLAGRQDKKEIDEVLLNKKFRIDSRTMRIIMEGEEGYEFASSPHDRRKSVFAALQSTRRLSKVPPGNAGSPLKSPSIVA